MKEQYLSDEKKNLYTRFLTTNDYRRVAKLAGYSFSSVNNILNQRTKVTEDNYRVIMAFNEVCRQRMQETKKLISRIETEHLLETA